MSNPNPTYKLGGILPAIRHATPEQIEQAKREYRRRLAICRKLGVVDRPTQNQIIYEIVTSPNGVIDPPMTAEQRRENIGFWHYRQYDRPIRSEQA